MIETLAGLNEAYFVHVYLASQEQQILHQPRAIHTTTRTLPLLLVRSLLLFLADVWRQLRRTMISLRRPILI